MIIPWRAISKHKRERREWLVAEEERKRWMRNPR
jgi:hypothetical protein